MDTTKSDRPLLYLNDGYVERQKKGKAKRTDSQNILNNAHSHASEPYEVSFTVKPQMLQYHF